MTPVIRREGGASFDSAYVANLSIEAFLKEGETHHFQNLLPEERKAALISVWEEATGEIVAVVTEQTLTDNPEMVEQGAKVGDLFSYKAHGTPEEALAEADSNPPKTEEPAPAKPPKRGGKAK